MGRTRFRSAQVFPAENGSAALFKLQTSQGEVELEVMRADLPQLMRSLIAASNELGAISPPAEGLQSAEPHKAVLLDAAEVRTQQVPPSGTWLYLRVGCTDFAVPFLMKASAHAVGHALLGPQTK